jgi:hypothetical protein
MQAPASAASTFHPTATPSDPEFASALVSYLEWGTRLAVINSQPDAQATPVQSHRGQKTRPPGVPCSYADAPPFDPTAAVGTAYHRSAISWQEC